jgi:hypothetical protein
VLLGLARADQMKLLLPIQRTSTGQQLGPMDIEQAFDAFSRTQIPLYIFLFFKDVYFLLLFR